MDAHVLSDGPQPVGGVEIRIALRVREATPEAFIAILKQDLAQIVLEMDAMATRNDVFGFATADTSFHRVFCSFAGNAVLSDMWEMLARQMTIIFGLSALGKPMADIVEEHRTLIRVFGSGDISDMALAISDHIDVEIHKVDLKNIIARRRSEVAAAAQS